MQELTAANGRPMPTIAVIPPTSIAATHDLALSGVNLDGLLAWANKRGKWWAKPPSGRFATATDIEGSLIAGTPARWWRRSAASLTSGWSTWCSTCA